LRGSPDGPENTSATLRHNNAVMHGRLLAGLGWHPGSKEALLFEKRSKNFGSLAPALNQP